MADPRPSQNAARLSEDIGDVLTAIRRMIADDDAFSDARDRVKTDRDGLVQDDAGEFLARRYGGNAALARRMVEQAIRPVPTPVAVEPEPETVPAIPQLTLRASPEAEPEAPKLSGWRAWLRPETRETATQLAAQPAPEPRPVPVLQSVVVADAAGDADDFAEAFDWKARMRPEIEEPAPMAVQAKSFEPRLSGWTHGPEATGFDPVAHLAAEAEAFDAELQAQSELQIQSEDVDQGIRELLREMVQEELNGELGERFSANLRAVIRREVAAAIEAHLDRF